MYTTNIIYIIVLILSIFTGNYVLIKQNKEIEKEEKLNNNILIDSEII